MFSTEESTNDQANHPVSPLVKNIIIYTLGDVSFIECFNIEVIIKSHGRRFSKHRESKDTIRNPYT